MSFYKHISQYIIAHPKNLISAELFLGRPDCQIQKYRIPRIQSTELKKINKQKGPSEGASISLGREKEIIMGGRGKEGSGKEWGMGREHDQV
jgi:hypothetical protein